jgi:hypothetical protein
VTGVDGRGAALRVGMKNFFTAQTATALPDGSTETVLCFAHPGDAIVLSLSIGGANAPKRYRFQADLRKEIKTDATVTLTSIKKAGRALVATWSNGTVLAIAARNPCRISLRRATVR